VTTFVEPTATFDLLLVGGDVVDGSGAPRFRADVGLSDGRIVAVGDLKGAVGRARAVVDASGRVVAPGFIDVHVHSEIALLAETPDAIGGVQQGVTTNLTGPDGFGFAGITPEQAREIEVVLRFVHGRVDLAFDWPTPESYLRAFEGRLPLNIAAQAPHLPIRVGVMGFAARRASDEEVRAMGAQVEAWMAVGAVGLNTGLDYQPTAHSDTRELVALARVAAAAGGVYAAHGRNIELGRAGQFRETARVGREAGLPVSVSHERIDVEFAGLLDEASADPGVDLVTDGHLYEAGSTHLLYYLPFEDQTGGPAAVLERLESPAYRASILPRLEASLAATPAAPDAWFSSTRTGEHVGSSVRAIAADRGLTPAQTIVELLREELPDALMVYPWGPTEAEFRPIVARSIADPRFIVSSDGIYQGERPHPRGYGTFPRAIRVGVRELGAISLEGAVHRMTGLPAARYRLTDRGTIAVGRAADLVVFDPDTFADTATYREPRGPTVGLDEVIVNGVRVVEGGRLTDRRPGRVLARASSA
jgi:N-acyl-D-amino-acid deacylase